MPNLSRKREMKVLSPRVVVDAKAPAAKLIGPDRASKPKHRFVVCSSTTGKLSDLETKKAIRRHIMQGLPRLRNLTIPVGLKFIFLLTSWGIRRHPLTVLPRRCDSLNSTADDCNQSTPQLTESPASSSSPSDSLDSQDEKVTSPRICLCSLVSILGQGRVNSFENYPIKMNTGEQWLIDQSELT